MNRDQHGGIRGQSVTQQISAAVHLGPDGSRRVHAAELFGDEREVLILHAGQAYRLRVTASGKLILTK